MTWTIGMSDADISTQTLAYTVATGREARLTVEFTNRSTSAAATIQLWVVPSGESVGNEHLKESGTTLSFAGTRQAVLTRNIIAPDGAKVYVQASTANVSCQVSGDVVATDTSAASITDGTSSITYGTNWSNYGSETSLKKINNLVTLGLAVVLSGLVTVPIATLPAGYRPISDINYIVGSLVDDSSGLIVSVFFSILTTGAIYVAGSSGSPVGTVATNDVARFTVSFFTS